MTDVLLTSSVLILMICAIRWLFKDRIRAKYRYALWGLVALRLMIPFSIQPFLNIMDRDAIWTSPYSALSIAQDIKENAINGTNLQPLVDNVTKGHVYTDMDTDSVLVKAASVDWELVIMIVWAAGAIFLCVMMLRNYVRFTKMLLNKRTPIEPEDNRDLSCPVYVVEGLKSPCLCLAGGQAGVYVTPEVAADPEKLLHVRVHEEMHARHSDLNLANLRTLLLCFYWVNPLVWLAAYLSKKDCELACDEAAVEYLGEEARFSYGRTLVSLVEEKTGFNDMFDLATTMTGSGKSIRERVLMLSRKKKHAVLATILVAVLAIGAAAFTFAGREEEAFLPETTDDEAFVVLSEKDETNEGPESSEDGTVSQAEVTHIEHEPIERPDWGIDMTVENIFPAGLTIVCIQSDVELPGELFTGSDYSLSRYENGEWVKVEYLPQEHDIAWTSEAWIIPMNDAVKWDVNWEWLYGELSPGTYTITKGVMYMQEPGSFETATYSVKFEI